MKQSHPACREVHTGNVTKHPWRVDTLVKGRVVKYVDPSRIAPPISAEEAREKMLALSFDKPPAGRDEKQGYHDPETALKQRKEGK